KPVRVVTPFFSDVEKLILSPAWRSSVERPSLTLNCSAAPAVLAPTVPACTRLIEIGPVRRWRCATVPVFGAPADARRRPARARVPAKRIGAIFMAASGEVPTRDKPFIAGFVPDCDMAEHR